MPYHAQTALDIIIQRIPKTRIVYVVVAALIEVRFRINLRRVYRA